jgi:Raf kinase inhibitor-like YbhB/YbcL family protein
MRTRLTGHLLLSLVVTLLTIGLASAQDRGQGAGAGAQGGGRGGGRGGGLAMLTVTSTSFADGAEIPAKYTGAQGTSPQLSWSGAPMGAASYVLIMHDVDVAIPAGNLRNDITHWVVWNIPASATSIPEGGPVPSGANQVSMRGPQYMGPAPPPGHPYHHYIFELFALNATLDVAAGATRADVEKAMEGKILARGAYVGRAKPAQ